MNDKNLSKIIVYLIARDEKIVEDWYKKNSSSVYDIMEKMVLFGHVEGSKTYITYEFMHQEFDKYINKESVSKKIIEEFKKEPIIKDNKGLSKILFLMPERTSERVEGYSLKDIKEYCKQLNVTCAYVDKFIYS